MPSIGVVGIPGAWSTQMLVEAFARRECETHFVDMSLARLDVGSGSLRAGELDLRRLDAVVLKKIGETYSPVMLDRLGLLRWLQGKGVRVFSEPGRIKRVLDRLSCTLELSLAGIPMPPTVITEDATQAVEAIDVFGKAVLKPVYTSKARGMRVVEAGPYARQAVESFQKEGNFAIYIQKLLNLPGRDLGLTFCGGEYLGCYARVGHGFSWNTTTASGGRYAPDSPEPDIIEIARRAQAVFGLDFTGVDIALSEAGPVVFEVSAFGGFRGLWEARQINAADCYADHVLRRLAHAA